MVHIARDLNVEPKFAQVLPPKWATNERRDTVRLRTAIWVPSLR